MTGRFAIIAAVKKARETARDAGSLLWRALVRWRRDSADRMAAALAYYSMFALAPLLMIGVAMSNYLEGRRRTEAFVSDLATITFGDRGVQIVRPMIESAPKAHAITLATVIGAVTMLYGASNLFVHLQASLNIIWSAEHPKDKSWLRAYVERRMFSVGVVFFLVLLLLLGPALNAEIGRLGRSPWLGLPLSLVVETAVFAAVYHLLPDVDLEWRHILPGCVLAAALFTGAQSLLALYLGRIASRSIYGAAGSLVALLIWVYVSAQILLYGAEFIAVLRERAARRGA